ncbi:GNAT family N-acetyltransferase [Lentzea tibetensis]|uniref:GNAT family N-acetyltransferase n=1 Tax=Lentzea tibetensis TaxID=2591470 RepID=A0A563EIH8_9PSEU|nr:GNAT family N-acetyltransferase [Lentzea tibetensis]TWP46322.1 GNAT family N-acetyltransferase [Lentzea tibetensis]
MDDVFGYTEYDADSIAPTWNARRVHFLRWRAGWNLSTLLVEWERRLTGVDDPDTAAIVTLPSLETPSIPALIRHHFAPLIVIASRPAWRSGPTGAPDVAIRPVTHADLDVAVELNMETVRYDAQFGVVTERENSAELLRASIAAMLDRDHECVWFATLDDIPVGMLYVDMPPHSDWMAQYMAVAPFAYIGMLGVRDGLRGRGVGASLVAHAHKVLDEAGVQTTLLHHAYPNPRSTPFWYSQGYQPVWTMWVRRPALRSSGVAP